MKLLIMSDIHGNLDALKKIVEKSMLYDVKGCIILGDIID